MFVPIYDHNPLQVIPAAYTTRALVLVTAAVFVVFQSGLVFEAYNASTLMFGVIPAVVNDKAALPIGYDLVPEPFTFLTYMFLHGNWLHLIGNMMFLWVFGDNVEDAMGHGRFLAFYLLCGAAAAVAHALAFPNSEAPLIGASGAVAGVIGAYLVLHPRVKVWVLVLLRIPLKITAFWVIGAWIAMQVLNAVTIREDNVAWWAHVGGLAAGVVLVMLMRRRGRALPETVE